MREWWEPANPYYDAEFERMKKEEDKKATIKMIWIISMGYLAFALILYGVWLFWKCI